MKLLVINYHCLKRQGISEKIFAKQLKTLKDNFQPISFGDCQGLSKTKNNYVIVTFDDGLKDGLKAAKVAKKLSFPLSFFVSGLPLKEQGVLRAQKIHLLMAKIGLDDFKKQFYELLEQEKTATKRTTLKKLGIKGVYRYDNVETKKFKLDLNYLLPQKISAKIVSQIFLKYFPREKQISQKLYLNLSELKKLLNQGFEIGGHSYGHPLLAALSAKEQAREITKCRQALNQISKKPLPFSVPFGHRGSFNQTTIKLLKKNNFFNLITMKRKINQSGFNTYDISRFDVNDIFEKNDPSKLKTI